MGKLEFRLFFRSEGERPVLEVRDTDNPHRVTEFQPPAQVGGKIESLFIPSGQNKGTTQRMRRLAQNYFTSGGYNWFGESASGFSAGPGNKDKWYQQQQKKQRR